MIKKIVNVIPLTYIPRPHSSIFSYETNLDLAPGSLVLVPFGKRSFPAIVKEMHQKNDPLPPYLKPILSIISENPVLPLHTKLLLEWVSKYYITPKGLVFKSVLSGLDLQKVAHAAKQIPKINKTKSETTERRNYAFGSDRFTEYNEQIAEKLSKDQNVLILVPTIKQETEVSRKLTPANKKRAVMLSSKNPKAQHELWLKLYSAKKTILIGAKKAVFAPLSDIGLIIIEDENNILHKISLQHPKYNTKETALALAQILKCDVIFGGELPSLESITESTEKIYNFFREPAQKELKIRIEDLTDKKQRKSNYRFSPKFLDNLEKIITKGGRVIILSARKGEASGLMCKDCEEIIQCPACSAPFALYTSVDSEQNKLICRHCGQMILPPKTCANCGGWRFKPIGLASSKIAEYLNKFFPEAKIFLFDGSTVKTDKDKAGVIEDFNRTKSSILIATKMALTEKIKAVDIAAIVAVDQFLTIPNFNAQEILFDTIIKLKSLVKSGGILVIQTYRAEQKILNTLEQNDFETFFKDELQMRKELTWPPYTKLIKITTHNKKEASAHESLIKLAENLSILKKSRNLRFEIIGPYPAYIRKIKNQYRWHILIKEYVADSNKLSFSLQDELQKIVSANFDIDVNPESIL